MAQHFHSCRDCKKLLAANTPSVKYAARHHLCAACAIVRGREFLQTLATWQLQSLPYGLIREEQHGLEAWLRAELEGRALRLAQGGQ